MKFAKTVLSTLSAAVLGLVTLGLASAPVQASTAITTQFNVTATIQATCLVGATDMTFGTYTGSALTPTSTITATCTNTTGYNVGISAGASTGATVGARKMTGPAGALLPYSLSSNSGHSVNWGNTIGTDTVVGIGNGSAQALTVYGSLAAGQYLAPGSYTDLVTVTVTY